MRMKQNQYDVAIIGSGIGGMCAAALLTHQGYRVLVAEKLPQLGGRCSTIEYKGFKIPYVAQEQPFNGITASIFREVGAEFELADQPPIVYRIGGQDYELPRKGGMAFMLSKVCKNEAELNRVGGLLRRMKTWEVASDTISFRDWLLQYTENELVLAIFQNVFCTLLMTVLHEVSAKDVVGFFNRGMREWGDAARPLRGNVALMESLAKVIRGRGGDIWTCTTAKQILTDDGVVKGIVVDKQGDEVEISAGAVVSNTGARQTMTLVGEEKLDKGYVRELKERLHHGSQFLISFASDRPLIEYPGGLGLLKARRVVTISTITLTCPELSPPGKYLLAAQCMPKTEVGPLNPEEEIAAAMEDLREHVPGFDKHAEVLNVSCFFNPDWPGYRNLAGYYPPQKTSIENLYNVGDGVAPFGQCGTPGSALTARIVTEDISNRMKPSQA
jgi:phytoene dehydrogenase-like protein